MTTFSDRTQTMMQTREISKMKDTILTHNEPTNEEVRLCKLFNDLTLKGYTAEKIVEMWGDLSTEEVLRQYTD